MISTPLKTLSLLALSLLTATLFTACSSDNGQGKQNSKHGLINTPPVAQESNLTLKEDTNPVIEQTAAITRLELSVETLSLNKDTHTTFTLTPTLSKGKVTQTLKDAIANPEFIITPSDAVLINPQTKTILAIKDTNVTIQAKIANALSNKVKLNIYWEVNGHRLPPEPDPKINNATLLGVDSNNNGVRDDVERWIYEKYKDKHPIYMDIAMQAARGYKLVLEHPEKAKEIRLEVDKATDCAFYYKYDAKYDGKTILIEEYDRVPDGYFSNKIYFNTKERKAAYDQYDTLLSGDSYDLPTPEQEKAACDFDTSKYDKE